MYLAIWIALLGIGIATLNWIFLVLSVVVVVLEVVYVKLEEQLCLQKYGQSYQEYQEKTPRWFGIPN